MKPETIEVIQEIELLSQMQFCGPDYLDVGHSIYDDLGQELGDIMFHCLVTDFNIVPDYLGVLNGSGLATIANALLENNAISQTEHDAAMAYYVFHVPWLTKIARHFANMLAGNLERSKSR